MKALTTIGIFGIAGSLMLFGPAALAQTGQGSTDPSQLGNAGSHGQLSRSDYRFFEKAARGGMEEVELGQLAQQKAANQTVREFGQRMVQDHSKANDELKQVAAQEGLAFPARMSRSENSTMQRLEGLNGASFDQAYAKDMVKDHTKDVNEFQKAAQSIQNPALRDWAQKTLPVLQEHLRLAKSMEAAVQNQK
jgi:putative membrane protein